MLSPFSVALIQQNFLFTFYLWPKLRIIFLLSSSQISISSFFSQIAGPPRQFLQYIDLNCQGRYLEPCSCNVTNNNDIAECKALCMARSDCGGVEVNDYWDTCGLEDANCVREGATGDWTRTSHIRVDFSQGECCCSKILLPLWCQRFGIL